MRLEQLIPNGAIRSIFPDAAVSVVSVEWHGSDALTLVYRGRRANSPTKSSIDTMSRVSRSSKPADLNGSPFDPRAHSMMTILIERPSFFAKQEFFGN